MKSLMKEDFETKFTTIEKVFEGKYAFHVLYALKDGKALRISEIQDRIGDISGIALRSQLKSLITYSLVLQGTVKGIIPKKEYSLTSFGRAFVPTLESLAAWEDAYVEYFKAHMDEIQDIEEDEAEYVDAEVMGSAQGQANGQSYSQPARIQDNSSNLGGYSSKVVDNDR